MKDKSKGAPRLTIDDARLYGFVLILGTLGFAFVASILMIAFSSNKDVLTFAFDLNKTLIGFFLGVGMILFRTPRR